MVRIHLPPGLVAELNLSPQRKREMLFEAVLHQLEALAKRRPPDSEAGSREADAAEELIEIIHSYLT
jgi:hypothetical protein